MIDKIDAEIERVKLEDGDVLVITSQSPVSMQQAKRTLDECRDVIRRLGVRAEVLILDKGLDAHLLKTSQLPTIEDADES